MIMFTSLVSDANQATNQANQDSDNSVVAGIVISYLIAHYGSKLCRRKKEVKL